ncbi:MAG: hypothetical protein LBU65_17230 [Planctomycetaceae bacterium]|jgi:hypothetical protein|nr:hypothetical protein [Planctomycetaceae bacterium]
MNIHKKVRDILGHETGGKSYKAHKYSLDAAERPVLDYGNNSIRWKKTAETTRHTTYVDLLPCRSRIDYGDQILSFFLDGSRRVFKIDDIAYPDGNNRSMIYPIIAGQIGVGCCRRTDKKIKLEKFKPEFVLSVPDVADANGKPGFFPATAKKLNDCEELKRLGIQFNAILPYKTSKNEETKFEDKATACVQDRMIENEKKTCCRTCG